MFVDCVFASSRIAQDDPGDEPLSEVVLSQGERNLILIGCILEAIACC
jgi:hypothetical protein